MKTFFSSILLALIFLTSPVLFAGTLLIPQDFAYLRDIDPSIIQEMRYGEDHNFVGRPIEGYLAKECILTRPAALQLRAIQQQLRSQHLSLKVYDCYRPKRAVSDFMQWSQQPQQQAMKKEFYPRIDKSLLFKKGYIATHSGHSRGSTVDLTIVPLPAPPQPLYKKGQPLHPCYADVHQRFKDNSLDMGGGYDCLDPISHIDNKHISPTAYNHRLLLKSVMEKNGFVPYEKEWWHFTLNPEPYPHTFFDFPIRPQS